jgi:hypothetical protein
MTPKSFNTINISGKIKMKSANKEILGGEIYFYQNISNDIKVYFLVNFYK